MSFQNDSAVIPGTLFKIFHTDGSVDSVYVDATVNEQHSVGAQITEHQVETGPDITDHIRPLPRRISIQGVITNTPTSKPPTLKGAQNIAGGGETKGRQFFVKDSQGGGKLISAVTYGFDVGDDIDRASLAYEVFEEAVQNGYLTNIFTTWKTYDHFALESFTAQRSAPSGNSLDFTIQAKEIFVAHTELVDAPAPRIQQQHKGNQPVKPATKEEEDQGSHFYRLAHGVK